MFAYRQETKFTYVERVAAYTDLTTEPARLLDSDPRGPSFPSEGGVAFSSSVLRYRPGLPLALKGTPATQQNQHLSLLSLYHDERLELLDSSNILERVSLLWRQASR
eukprot:COSAG04_NODE_1192_length_7801_cov_7.001298_13_plen_107_part_00